MPEKKPEEMKVIMVGRELCGYVLQATHKSPKEFRYSVSSRLQNLSLDVLENLYRANEVYVEDGPEKQERRRQRLDFQQKAMTSLRMLTFFAELGLDHKVILFRHYDKISDMVITCMKMIVAWMNSDRNRFGTA